MREGGEEGEEEMVEEKEVNKGREEMMVIGEGGKEVRREEREEDCRLFIYH